MSALFNPATIWVLIPLAAIIGSFIVKSQRIRSEGLRTTDGDKLLAELGQSVRRLEERVGNLERAVTTAESERKYAL
jgi:hypothetical protein